jgi:hypothetical protein
LFLSVDGSIASPPYRVFSYFQYGVSCGTILFVFSRIFPPPFARIPLKNYGIRRFSA